MGFYDFRLFLSKIVNFGFDLHISDAKTDPFIPSGADLFCIFESHRYSNNILKELRNATITLIQCKHTM